MREAIFLPTPCAIVSVFSSCVNTASVSWSGVMTDKMASAAFVPTPETVSSSSKQRSSSRVEKPKMSNASSRTLQCVKSFAAFPGWSCASV